MCRKPGAAAGFVLNGEVDQRGRAAESRSAGAGFKIVGAGGASEGHVEMRVHVDAAGENIFSSGVQNLRGIFSRQIFADGRDLTVRDGNVCHVRIGCGHHGSVGDDRIEAHYASSRSDKAR